MPNRVIGKHRSSTTCSKSANHGSINKTAIMYRSKLSYRQLARYRQMLQDREMINLEMTGVRITSLLTARRRSGG